MLRTREYADSGGELGTRIWRYARESDSFEWVGTFSGSDLSEVEFLSNNSGFSFLVSSDFIWAENEAHLEDHHFRISIYRYLPEGRFEPVLDYVTDAKHPITEGDEIVAKVLRGEFDTITARIRASHPAWDPGSAGVHMWTEQPRFDAGPSVRGGRVNRGTGGNRRAS
jgi:hypothetical protein